MSEREDYDSDAPEEFTAEQGIQQEQELSKLQKENKARVSREGKERRRKWAQKKTPRKATTQVESSVQDASENETHEESCMGTAGMLPSNIVELLAAREKQVFSDCEDEKDDSKPKKKKKRKSSGVETIILNQTAPPPCLEKSLEFLKQRKMQVILAAKTKKLKIPTQLLIGGSLSIITIMITHYLSVPWWYST